MGQIKAHFLQRRWFFVAAIVGTLLNLINQWEAVLGEAVLDYPKLMLTYVVPYCVSSMSAWQAKESA